MSKTKGNYKGVEERKAAQANARSTGNKSDRQGANGDSGPPRKSPRPDTRQAQRVERNVSIPLPAILVAGIVLIVVVGAYFLSTQRNGPTAAGQLSPVATLQASDYHSLAVSPEDRDRLWFGSHAGIQESTDGGRIWNPLPGMSGDAMNMARPVADPKRIYIAGHDIFKHSTDGGRSWQDVQTDLPGTDLHGFAADATNAEHVYAFVAGQGIFESKDGGNRWAALPAQPPGATGGLAVVPGDPPTLYVVTQLGVMISRDAGHSWHPSNSGLPEGQGDVRALVPVPGRAQELYAGTAKGLYHTGNIGANWQQVALAGQDIYALATSQSGPLRIYALTSKGAVFRLEGTMLGNTQ